MGEFDKLRIHDVNVTPGGDLSLLTEFWAYQPLDKYAKEEQPGDTHAVGVGEVKAIPANKALPHVNLEQHFKDLIERCWQKASGPTPGASRGPIMMAGHRPAPAAAVAQRAQYIPMVSPTKPAQPLPHLQGVANDWDLHEGLKRVNAYTFRGDTRMPAAIKKDGGFNPPVTRNDAKFVEGALYTEFQSYMKRRFNKDVDKDTFLAAYNHIARTKDERDVMFTFFVWRELAKSEAMHIGRMVANETLKGYISTARSTVVAKGFAKANGWVYVVLVNGAFQVPAKGKHAWTATFGEQEIAYPGSLPWSQVMGSRQVTPAYPLNFTGPLFLRKGFESKETKDAFEACFKALSGKKQD